MAASRFVTTALCCTVSASLSLASSTRVVFEASTDGGLTYQRNVTAQPGSTVFVQMRMQWVGPGTVLGLAGGVYQPTLSNWDAAGGDTMLPFSNIYVPEFGTPDGIGVCGKLAPWGVVNQYSPLTASGPLTGHRDPGGVLRIAGANNITPTRNLAWGINTHQFELNRLGTSFSNSTDCVVFRYGVEIGTSTVDRTLVATAPLELFVLGRLQWHVQANGLNPLRDTLSASDFTPATIHVPTTGSIAVLLTFAWPWRRRR